MRRNFRRVTAVLLAASMVFSTAACGKKEKADRDGNASQTVKEYTWVPQFIELDGEGMNYYNAQIKGESLYCMNYGWDEAASASSISVRVLSLADGTVTGEFPLGTGEAEEKDGIYVGRNINRFAIDSKGVPHTLEQVYTYNAGTGESSQSYFLCRYDAGGSRIAEQELANVLTEETYVNGFALDSEDRVYVVSNDGIYLFDSEGVYRGSIGIGANAYVSALGEDRDGAMCAVVSDYAANQDNTTLREIDFDKKDFGAVYNGYIRGYSEGIITPGLEKATLAYDDSKVYEYDKAGQSGEELFSWLDSDINGSNVRAVGVLGDGRIAVITEEYTGERNQSELVLLTKTKSEDLKQKTILTLGCVYEDDRIRAAAVRFNKQSDAYRVSIRSYYDRNAVTADNYRQVMYDAINRLNSDIASRNCPDLLEVNSLNMTQLAAKGVFEDLTPYLEKSSVLSREDYDENILDSYSYDGKLLIIPRSFYLLTVAGKTSEVGEKPGWTLQELLAYADRHPGAAIFDYATKSSILQFLMSYSQSDFVDWEKGECRFNTDEFRDLLEFASRFPDEYNYDSDDQRSTPAKIAAGEILLMERSIYDFRGIQEVEGMFGEPVTFIGFPNAGGNSGCYLQVNGQLAITSKSANKDGAWTFLESYLDGDYGWADFGLPTKKSALQEKKEKATAVEYVLDEDGNQVLDEEGKPIIQGVGGSVMYPDGWTYEYHTTTQEEVDKLMELIRIARPVTDSDTQVMEIISEEAEAFFKGDKSAADVADVIQRRVQVYVNENH